MPPDAPCDRCGTWIELHITPRRPPTCAHTGTRRDAKRAADMKEEETGK